LGCFSWLLFVVLIFYPEERKITPHLEQQEKKRISRRDLNWLQVTNQVSIQQHQEMLPVSKAMLFAF
jgi:hypothetical protein